MDENKKDIYKDGTYFDLHPEMHVADSYWKAQHILNTISKNNLEPKNICEVGCGAGEIIKIIHNSLPNKNYSCGYEISPQAFELCKTREEEGLDFFLGEPSNDNETFFDLLLCIDVFEHVDDYLGFITNLKDKSKYKIFHIPLDISVQSILRETPIIISRKETGHLHYYTEYMAIETLKHCGYKILDQFYTLTSVERGTGTLLNRLSSIPRSILFKINQHLAVKLLGGASLMVLAE